MECNMILVIAMVLFIGGSLYLASKIEKKVLIALDSFGETLLKMKSEFDKELNFNRIERDNLMLQQDEVLKNLTYLHQKDKEKKADDEIANQDFNDRLTQIKSNNNSIKR